MSQACSEAAEQPTAGRKCADWTVICDADSTYAGQGQLALSSLPCKDSKQLDKEVSK